MNDVAVAVGHDLKFDVVRIDDQFLDVNLGVAERLLRFHARAVKAVHQAGFVVRRAHAAAAAAGDRFDHHRIADFFRDLDRVLFVSTMPSLPGRDRNTGFARACPRGILVAHRVHRAAPAAR